ncbi:hypothetical protein TWF481_003988 [Arthrobotrys musiformis]|uniref:Anaphase-promoting complex subunit 1 n=1 Tax=Arthrobotrys musiformis TaxID=47236 RepID=A0AAV9WK86_9PEZI
MADAPDTKVPVAVKLTSRARLLSYRVKEDITAPAQYYPYSLPRDKKSELTDGATDGNNKDVPHDNGNDKSVIIYGTKTGLTILYPLRCRLRGGQASPQQSTNTKGTGMDADDSDFEMEMDDGSWVVFRRPDGKLLEEPFPKKVVPNPPEYESYSEPEEYNVQRNARFPWKYSVELDSPVIEFAVPGPSHAVPEHAYLESHPWLEKIYITAITADGRVHLVILPLRLPPPGVSSTDVASNHFPVHTILLRARKEGQIRPKGICLDFMRRIRGPASP